MSEIKEGDIVIVNGYAAGFGNSYSNDDYEFFDNQRGMVKSCSYLDKNKIEISPVNAIGKFYKKTYLVHIKQCRKLVKVKVCDSCKGLGNAFDPRLLIYHLVHRTTCTECKGAGKIRK